MNRTRRWVAGSYHLLMFLATLMIPLLIFYGSRGRGADTGYGMVGAILAFAVLLAYLIIPNLKRR
ncbi:hypothetical protein C8P63_11384 [Melghirimyces profundicolus]|uniref:Uncharacterized protein n=1 Tax=Melghirimyces profundicolus TaxID=1242148 RepID=A0A2T6BSX1_9BACL|nr:hypothetical protein [Melghirimyces profundicolus]PTX59139.1 hypothetical protein C8P63_11384 [Melghirimyces profundicolus]